MADRTFHPVKSLGHGLVFYSGRITIGATGAPTIVTTNGQSKGLTSFTRAAAGTYDVILADKFVAYEYIHAEVLEAGADDFTVQTEQEAPTSGTFSLFFNTAGTATELPSGSAVRYIVIAKLSNV